MSLSEFWWITYRKTELRQCNAMLGSTSTRCGVACMNDFDLNDVRTFVSVAQAGTLTAAAKELHCPASTLSRALTRLEKHLGVLVVQRGPRGLVLTDAGKEYLQSWRRALQSLQRGRDVLEVHRCSPSGLLKVACPVTMARDAIAPLLKEF